MTHFKARFNCFPGLIDATEAAASNLAHMYQNPTALRPDHAQFCEILWETRKWKVSLHDPS